MHDRLGLLSHNSSSINTVSYKVMPARSLRFGARHCRLYVFVCVSLCVAQSHRCMRPGTSVSGSCLLNQSSSPGLTLLLKWGRSTLMNPGRNLFKRKKDYKYDVTLTFSSGVKPPLVSLNPDPTQLDTGKRVSQHAGSTRTTTRGE